MAGGRPQRGWSAGGEGIARLAGHKRWGFASVLWDVGGGGKPGQDGRRIVRVCCTPRRSSGRADLYLMRPGVF